MQHDARALRQHHHHDVVLAALALVDGRCVGQIQLSQLVALIHLRLRRIIEHHVDALPVNRRHPAHVAIKDSLLVVVLRLHHPVALAVDGAVVLRLRPFWIQSRLQDHVEHVAARRVLAVRAEHLNLLAGIPRWQTGLHQTDDLLSGLLIIVHSVEEEITLLAVVERREIAVDDAVRVLDDQRTLCLTVYLCQLHRRDLAALDEVAQHPSGRNTRQLVVVTDDDELRARQHRFQQRLHQQQIHHRRFVADDDIGLQRVILIAPELPVLELQQPVDGLRVFARHLAHAFGRPASRRTEFVGVAVVVQHREHSAQRRCLTRTGAARQDHHAFRRRHADSLALLVVVADTRLSLCLADDGLVVARVPGACQRHDSLRHVLLCPQIPVHIQRVHILHEQTVRNGRVYLRLYEFDVHVEHVLVSRLCRQHHARQTTVPCRLHLLL